MSEFSPQRDVALDALNSFGLNARADFFFELNDKAQLPGLFAWLQQHSLPLLLLGEGSNVLLTGDFKGLVLSNRLKGVEVEETDEQVILDIAAGENWHELVQWCLANSYYGLENLALIPGNVGAAPVQNIGAYGVEIAQRCLAVEYFDLETGQLQWLSEADCKFGYRDSIFKHALKGRALITQVRLALPQSWEPVVSYGPLAKLGDDADAEQIFDTVVATRSAKLPDPSQLGNAGSFFKNPVVEQAKLDALLAAHPELPHYPAAQQRYKLAAGWLIDSLGLKGFQLGGAAVHKDQALVLVNTGSAVAADILALCQHVRQQVWIRYGVELEPEVRFIGERGEVHYSELVESLS
ncbi:UDP-N-acetylmuramate dehydrogenase [Aliagarivorans taiwanensis]|uniref:UDP-N-acetylmuramate dehydrogenase n=1 Tax=Aliagarivorans taiwanensis TaxID=561966 RepID=UPI0004283A52|nr:UDP-N-acetylmuramate dehydrogenase [Aliagarivorans taiwanensis]